MGRAPSGIGEALNSIHEVQFEEQIYESEGFSGAKTLLKSLEYSYTGFYHSGKLAGGDCFICCHDNCKLSIKNTLFMLQVIYNVSGTTLRWGTLPDGVMALCQKLSQIQLFCQTTRLHTWTDSLEMNERAAFFP